MAGLCLDCKFYDSEKNYCNKLGEFLRFDPARVEVICRGYKKKPKPKK